MGSIVHVMKRGARGAHLVRDDFDRTRFLMLIRYLNDAHVPRNWERDITREHIDAGFSRPDHWPEAKPYVSILSFCLLDNHFHLLVRENVEGGISKFMQRVGTSMSAYFNARHGEKGTLFQGTYKARTIENDEYLQYVLAYIQVKNALELYPHGMRKALSDFDEAFKWVEEYAYGSLHDYASSHPRELIDMALARELFPGHKAFRRFAEDVMYGRYLPEEESSL